MEMDISGAVELYKALAEIPTVSSAEIVADDEDEKSKTVSLVLSQRSHSTLSRYTARQQLLLYLPAPASGRSIDDHGRVDESGEGVQVRAVPPGPSVQAGDDTIKAICSAFIPSLKQTRTALLREDQGDKDKGIKRRSVELWHRETKLSAIDVTEIHAAFIVDDTFGSLSLCPVTGQRILYAAEARAPEKRKKMDNQENSHGEPGLDGLEAFEYRPGLGEKMGGRTRPTVWMATFPSNTMRGSGSSSKAGHVARLAVDGDELKAAGQDIRDPLLGQAVFDAKGESIITTAYSLLADGRRLGIIYCTNRPAAILRAYLDNSRDDENRPTNKHTCIAVDKWTRLSAEGVSARSPRIIANPNSPSTAIVWLQNEEAGAHNDCAALASYDDDGGNDDNCREMCMQIPIQSRPSDNGSGWPGLYLDQLPRTCQVDGGLVTSTIWGCRKTIILRRLAPASASSSSAHRDLEEPVQDLTPPSASDEQPWSYTVLCTDGKHLIVAVRSSPLRPQQLLVGQLFTPTNGPNLVPAKVSWTMARDLGGPYQHKNGLDALSSLEASVVEQRPSTDESEIAGRPDNDSHVGVQSIVLRPSSLANRERAPAGILFPHGGPHGATTTDWNPALAALAACDYSIVLPNFRGSLGRGQDFAHALLGRCGDIDVKDCLSALEQHLVEPGLVDSSRLIVMGGSHGGFLSAHLIGQHPDVFKAAVMRNPVVSIGTMEPSTDIPDWCYSELGLDFRFEHPPSFLRRYGPNLDSAYEVLQSKSPIQHVDRVKAAVLLLVGLDDQRVPPTQSKLYYHALIGRRRATRAEHSDGPAVRMLCFDGADHALDTVEAEVIGWEASLRWIDRHT